MSYEKINPIQQFNFQINRVLTYGDIACDVQAIRKETASIRTFEEWKRVWYILGKKAEQKKEYLRAAYCFRMAEFFMKSGDSEKEFLYRVCIQNFYKAFDTQLHLPYIKHNIPYEGKTLNCIEIKGEHALGTVLVCGGYDSFIEEFVLQVRDLACRNYNVILFEGPGQGGCLSQKMYFQYDFEKPVKAVLDYFQLKECAMIGISWGGYFAVRSAAFEKRIKAVAAYDVMENGFEVMTNIFPLFLCKIIRIAYYLKRKNTVNKLAEMMRKKSVLADWAFSQGMYITGTAKAYDFYKKLSQHKLAGITENVTQDVLLLAGEKDHYIPSSQFHRLKNSLPNAHSLTCRMYTEKEGGEQHCQIGNHLLAVNDVIHWLNHYYSAQGGKQRTSVDETGIF